MAQQAAAPPTTGAARRGRGSPYVALAIVLSATFVQLVDISIVNTAIPSIQRELSASYGAIQLVLAGYLLAFACTLITAARLGDIYGRKRLFMIGMFGFTVASAVCGAAPNALTLVLARVVQGLASGLMFPQVLSVIQVTFPPRERGKAFGILGATIGLATVLGPLLGGALIQWNLFGTDWRMIFYVNLPVGIGAFIAAILFLGESRAPAAHRLDIPGALLVTIGLFMLVFPLTEGRDRGWPGWILLMLAASLPLLAAFTGYEWHRTRESRSPLLEMTLFRNRAFRVGALLSLVFFLGLPPFFFTFSLYIQIGQGFTALGAGLTSFPFAVGSGIASANSDRLTRRLGTNVLLLGTAVLTLGMCLVLLTVHVVGTTPHAWQFAPAFLVAGAGLGLFVAPVTNIVLAGIRGREAGSASGVLSTVQQTGGAIGVAIVGVIFFALIGANAGRSASAVADDLRGRLVAAGLPAPAQEAALAQFRTCFSDRAHAKDPSATPPSCRPRPGAPPQVQTALADAGRGALARNFSRSFQQTLSYEITIYALAFLVVLRLPKVDPHEMGPAGAAPA